MNKAAYITIATIVFIVFIAVMTPASLLAALAREDIQQSVPGLKMGASSGRIWQGEVQLQYHQFPPVLASWDVHFLQLFKGSISTSIKLNGDGIDLVLDAAASSSSSSLENISGTIDSSFINTVSVGYGLDLTGEFELEQTSALLRERWLTELDGSIYWSGGIVHIETPAQFHSVKLPVLSGKLSMQGSDAILNVSSDNTSLLTLSLKPDGWSQTSVSYQLMDMAGLPLPNNYQNMTGPALIVEEKVF